MPEPCPPDTQPLRALQQQAGAEFIRYGDSGPDDDAPPIELVDTFGQYEAEYAAIRKSAGLIELPQLGVIELRGADRQSFLQRLLTADIGKLDPGETTRAFFLAKTGRIIADMTVLHGEEVTCLVLDRIDIAQVAAELDKYLFAEDLQINDATLDWTHLALCGPKAAELIASVAGHDAAIPDTNRHAEIATHEHLCRAYLLAETGSHMLHLLVPTDAAVEVYKNLSREVDHAPNTHAAVETPPGARPIGWLAYNTARIEAGSPLFHIDFGPDTLPHETSLIDQAVSFTKGCYVGQEVVARMQSLGHPKKVLVGLRFKDDRMPVCGVQVYAPDADDDADPPGAGPAVGAVTSSTLSPMLGGDAIALAMVRWGSHTAGTTLLVPAEGGMVPTSVQPGLSFL